MDLSTDAGAKREAQSASQDGSKLFGKTVYFASGIVDHDVGASLENGGAKPTRMLSDSVTHCLVGEFHSETDVSAASELYDLPTVTPEWVRTSVLCQTLLPTKPFDVFEDHLFKGLDVCVSQLSANDCKTLWALVTYNGGTFRLILDLKRTTHLVVAKPNGKKYAAVLSKCPDKIKVVTPDWIIDCLTNKAICSESNYHPRLLLISRLPSNSSYIKHISGLSTITGFADIDSSVESPEAVVSKNQGLEQLKQRLPWNQPATPPSSDPDQDTAFQTYLEIGTQSNKFHTKPMSLKSTSQLKRLSRQQVQHLQLQHQAHANAQLKQQHNSQLNAKHPFSTQQLQQQIQIELQHGPQLQFQSTQKPVRQGSHNIQLQQQQQMVQNQQSQLSQLKQQSITLQQGQQHIQQMNQFQQNQQHQHPNQCQQIQQIQYQTGNDHLVQFSQQQVTQNSQAPIQQKQQQQSPMKNVQSSQFSQIGIVSSSQQIQHCSAQQSGTVSPQGRMTHPPSNMPGLQQILNMDVKTHQHIQAMKPSERLVFISKLAKQKDIVMQQYKTREQQANIHSRNYKETIKHQLTSASGVTQTQQAQWNQIRQQELLVQPQQQMSGRLVPSGLPTDLKTVNDTLVNSQHVAVWQESTVSEQGNQQTAGSTCAAQLAAKFHERQYLQQLRSQQHQMDATQKQQKMQHQVAPQYDPNVGVTQSNVVQSLQVATAQSSIVQPTNDQPEAQTSIQGPFAQASQSNQQALVANPKTKTALINMLSTRLQNGISSSASAQQQHVSLEEISAAEKLMTAQCHFTQHQNQQQNNLQGTYQSMTVLNTVSNSAASNRAAVQTAVANTSLPANYNQLAAARAKSAAGPPVDLQRFSHQDLFFGHHPNLMLLPNKCLLGCVFLIVEYDCCTDTMNEVPTWKKIILNHGGEIELSYTTSLTHILCQTQKHPLVKQGLLDGKRCITAYWLSDTITKQLLVPPWYALHFPTPFSEERPCDRMIISLTNFENEERNRVKFMIELTGARVTSYFSAENNFLVTRNLKGKKVKKAREINRPVVNVQWLNEILFGHLSCIYQPKKARYQQFNISNPFKVDYNLVRHLMRAWKVPVNVTRELYVRVCNDPTPAKKVRLVPSQSDFINQENNDLSTADIVITNIDPPSVENRPCVMLSRFGLAMEEQRMVLRLGGTIAKNFADVTHLVMKEAVRTTKFLCCVSTVKHIVNADWLRDSSAEHIFLEEAIYTIEEVSVGQEVICKVHEILSNPNRHELFKGKIFYVTPGVTQPPVSVIRQIIESASGTVEKQRRSLRSIRAFEPNTYFVIATNNDLHLVAYLLRASYGIYSAEFVLSAVMTQRINYDMAFIKPDFCIT